MHNGTDHPVHKSRLESRICMTVTLYPIIAVVQSSLTTFLLRPEFLALKYKRVGFSDIHPTLYVVSPRWNRLDYVLFAHRELAWLFLEPHTGLDHCLRILLLCFGARTSGYADENVQTCKIVFPSRLLFFIRKRMLAFIPQQKYIIVGDTTSVGWGGVRVDNALRQYFRSQS